MTEAMAPDSTPTIRRAERAEAERDGAYRERAQLLAWLATLHTPHAVLAPAVDIDDEDGWWLLFLTVAGRQLSWHIAPRDVELFNHVERVDVGDPRAQWDGHTTAEKYQRIRTLPFGEMRDAVRTPDPAEATTARLLSALHKSAEEDVTRVTALYEQWVKAGPPPLGASMARWWDARLAELRQAIRPPEEEEPVIGTESQVDVERLADEDGTPICTCTYGERCPNCRD